jgi:hypothetical protein
MAKASSEIHEMKYSILDGFLSFYLSPDPSVSVYIRLSPSISVLTRLGQADRYYLYLSISCHISRPGTLGNDAIFSELSMKNGPQECTYSLTPSSMSKGI